jgi:phage terminase Nu1 subunit (DNA packaging protein)
VSPDTEAKFVDTLEQLADVENVSRSTVLRWKKNRVVVYEGSRIDVLATRAKVASTVGEIRGRPRGEAAPSPFVLARAEHEKHKAALAELKLQEKAGRLHDVEACRVEGFEEGRRVRDAVLSVPDRLSAVLAAEANERKVHALLAKELRTVLERSADGE